jgi:hypothetical protein
MLVTAELNADDIRKAVIAYVTQAYTDRPMRLVAVNLADRIRATGPAVRLAIVELETLELRGDGGRDDDEGDRDGPRPWTFLPRQEDDDDDGPDPPADPEEDRRS